MLIHLDNSNKVKLFKTIKWAMISQGYNKMSTRLDNLNKAKIL